MVAEGTFSPAKREQMQAVAEAPVWGAASELAGATILLVEDEPTTAESIAACFSACGAHVWHAETGADARAIVRTARPDVIVLDLSLPDVDGLVLCPRLRAEAEDVPIVICSDSPDRRDMLLAFKLGAEDFITKPVDLDELQARVEVAVRRRARGQSAGLRALRGGADGVERAKLGELEMDLARWRVVLAGQHIHLTPTEFKLVRFLVSRVGEIVSRDELARMVWGDASMRDSRTIDAYVRRVRDKLSGAAAPTIVGVRGLGYQLLAAA
jgi:DNA-binding response OmpR family regulator